MTYWIFGFDVCVLIYFFLFFLLFFLVFFRYFLLFSLLVRHSHSIICTVWIHYYGLFDQIGTQPNFGLNNTFFYLRSSSNRKKNGDKTFAHNNDQLQMKYLNRLKMCRYFIGICFTIKKKYSMFYS